MPAYIHEIHLDWHVGETPAALLPIVMAANERLDCFDHTFDTFRAQLTELAAAHPTLVVDALVENGYNAFTILRARNGAVTSVDVEERPEGAAGPTSLPYDGMPELDDDDGEDDFETIYDDLEQLHAAIANRRGSGGAVVSAGGERYVLEVNERGATVTKLVVITERALFERLRSGRYARPPAPDRVADQKYATPLYWPQDMLDFLQQHAVRADRSLSYLAQLAFKTARQDIQGFLPADLRIASELAGGGTRKQTLYFPGEMLDAIDAQAARLDTSSSLVIQVAVSMARATLVALQPPAY